MGLIVKHGSDKADNSRRHNFPARTDSRSNRELCNRGIDRDPLRRDRSVLLYLAAGRRPGDAILTPDVTELGAACRRPRSGCGRNDVPRVADESDSLGFFDMGRRQVDHKRSGPAIEGKRQNSRNEKAVDGRVREACRGLTTSGLATSRRVLAQHRCRTSSCRMLKAQLTRNTPSKSRLPVDEILEGWLGSAIP